jgi:hypothetical protein
MAKARSVESQNRVGFITVVDESCFFVFFDAALKGICRGWKERAGKPGV